MGSNLEAEARMIELGKYRAQSNLHKALAGDRIAETPAGMSMQKRALEKYVEATKLWTREALHGKAGSTAIAAKYLEHLNIETTCYIAFRTILNHTQRRDTLASISKVICNNLELELLPDLLKSKNEGLYWGSVKAAREKHASQKRHAQSVIKAGRITGIIEGTLWTFTEKLHLGAKLIDIFIETTGLVEPVLKKLSPNRKSLTLVFTPEIQEWIRDYNNLSLLANPFFLPLSSPPKKWTGMWTGGYETIVSFPLVTKPSKNRIEALSHADLSMVYNGVNALQETAWRINERVLNVMEILWERDAGVPGMPAREDLPIPEKPEGFFDAEPGSEIRTTWRGEARHVHDTNIKSRSHRFRFAHSISLGKQYASEPRIYFPHKLDFRGRAYANGTTLNPQGPDEVRGLLEFAEGKPLDARGIWWLGVHGANLYGEDKISLDDRAEWAHAFTQQALQINEDPVRNLDWTEADSPWQFLAWCFEWGQLHSISNNVLGDFVSHIPVHLDGSCNGIQHFSAMLRDEVGGASVNLLPGDKPSDIYQTVADRAKEILAEITLDSEPGDLWMAQTWLAIGFDRKMTKRSVMTLPYGATFYSCMKYTEEAYNERLEDEACPFGPDNKRAALVVLSKAIWKAISDVVIKAREAMDWLQKVSYIVSKHNLPIKWTTPSGFVVLQEYKKVKHRRVKTVFQGSLVYFSSYENLDVVDSKKQASALSPNFVHSLDAAVLMLTLSVAKNLGIHNLTMIHDSYATLAADTETLAIALRTAFVTFYENNDVLEAFRDEILEQLPEGVKLPELPSKGELDINQVLNSEYFFA